VVGDVGMADIDWGRFNRIDLKRGDPCHPSVYGYARIADYVAALLRNSGVWDRVVGDPSGRNAE